MPRGGAGLVGAGDGDHASFTANALITHATPASVTVITFVAIGGALVSMYALTTISTIPPRPKRVRREVLAPIPVRADR